MMAPAPRDRVRAGRERQIVVDVLRHALIEPRPMTSLGDLLDVGIVPVLVEAFERRHQRRLRETEDETRQQQ